MTSRAAQNYDGSRHTYDDQQPTRHIPSLRGELRPGAAAAEASLYGHVVQLQDATRNCTAHTQIVQLQFELVLLKHGPNDEANVLARVTPAGPVRAVTDELVLTPLAVSFARGRQAVSPVVDNAIRLLGKRTRRDQPGGGADLQHAISWQSKRGSSAGSQLSRQFVGQKPKSYALVLDEIKL